MMKAASMLNLTHTKFAIINHQIRSAISIPISGTILTLLKQSLIPTLPYTIFLWLAVEALSIRSFPASSYQQISLSEKLQMALNTITHSAILMENGLTSLPKTQ
jgi:hypothetical protein